MPRGEATTPPQQTKREGAHVTMTTKASVSSAPRSRMAQWWQSVVDDDPMNDRPLPTQS
jgi:hypothetical protein